MRRRMVSDCRFTIGYLAALGLVALPTVASHATLNRVLTEHENSAEISGRQRVLSQRIAGLAAQQTGLAHREDLLQPSAS